MRKLILGVLFLILLSTAVLCQPPPKTTRKDVGDINGDGKPETLFIYTVSGASASTKTVKIQSAGKIVLTLPQLSDWNGADGYQLMKNRQIACWTADYGSSDSKWDPHYYDFFWYEWSSSLKRFLQSREGFTKKRYGAKAAETAMPRLAQNPGRDLVLSKEASFLADAKLCAYRRFHYRCTSMEKGESSPDCGRFYWGDAQLGRGSTFVRFMRDGRVNINQGE